MRTLPPVSVPGCLVGFLLATGCGGTGPTPPPPPPPPPASGADVQISLAGPAETTPGTQVTYRITIRNQGPEEARDVTVRAQKPAAFVGTASDGGVVSAAEIVWPIASLAVGASVERTVAGPAPLVGPLVVQASAAAATADPVPGNNGTSSTAGRVTTVIGFERLTTLAGEAPGDQFGWLIEPLGDVTGDGVADFVVTAPTNDAGGSNAGRAYVYSGSGGLLLTHTGAVTGAQFGYGVSRAGDIDQDGVPDLIIGAPFSGAGSATVFSGKSGSVLYALAGERSGDQFGRAVSDLGDVDGDGVDDFLVTAPGFDGALNNSGRVYIYSGGTGAVLRTKEGQATNGTFGASVGGLGDLNGDGIPDFGVGAPTATGTGRVYVLNGATADILFTSIPADGTGGGLGQFWLNSPGDVNGDGRPDIFAADIGNGARGQNTGRAYLFSGASGATLHTFTGEIAGDQFGIGRGTPDVDGDGVGDLILAAWLNNEGGGQAGKAYVYSGRTGALLRTMTSITPGARLGFDANYLGDVDGDGVPEFLLSAIPATGPGEVFVVRGRALAPALVP